MCTTFAYLIRSGARRADGSARLKRRMYSMGHVRTAGTISEWEGVALWCLPSNAVRNV
jgi:hypothetical protein